MEPRVSERRAQRIIYTLGFTDHFRVPFIGLVGGLQVLLDYVRVNIEIIGYTTQAIHMFFSFNNDEQQMYIAAYANPVPAQCQELWDFLFDVSSHITITQLVAGDFNDIATLSKKWEELLPMRTTWGFLISVLTHVIFQTWVFKVTFHLV